MHTLRLSPFVSLLPTPSGVFVRSDLRLFRIGGPDLEDFVSRLLPLLDGTRDPAALVKALPEYSPDSVRSLLRTLEKQGVVQRSDSASAARRRTVPTGQDEFFRLWPGRPGEHQERLARSRALIVGLEPWGVVGAVELAAAGVGALDLVDDGRVTREDVSFSRVWDERDVGKPRRAALKQFIRRHAPSCRVASYPLEIDASGALLPKETSLDLVIATTDGDDLRAALAVARWAHARALRSLFASTRGLDAILGPLVRPGETACWNCFRCRSLAHAAPFQDTHDLHDALLDHHTRSRAHTYLGPMLPMLGHLVAMEALKILSGYTPSTLVGRISVTNLVTLETQTHAVIPLPWCEVCGGAAAAAADPGTRPSEVAERVARASDPSALRRALDGWVGEQVGVIRTLEADFADPRGPDLPFTASAVLAEAPAELNLGSGRGLSLVDAMRGAVGEALERYSAMQHPRDALKRCALERLGGDAIDPRQLFFYEEARYPEPAFPYAPFDPEQPLEWVEGRWVDGGDPVWVPALSAYLGYDAAPAEQLGQITTNGLAAGRDFEDAGLRALFELVERDAFMLTWLARLPARRLDVGTSAGPEGAEVLRQLGEQGASVQLYLLEVGHTVPVVACISYGDGRRWPGAALTLGCHLSPRTAALRAILEHGQSCPHLRAMIEAGTAKIPATPDDVVTLMDHALYYFPRERAEAAFEFLRRCETNPIPLVALEEPEEITLASCGARLSGAGLRAALVDVTSPDLRSGPFRVARAVGPWFQPVDFGHRLRRLANPRLRRFASALNPDPHPLA